MITGNCLCRGIQYEYDGVINELAICHCNQCKRAQGTAFAINAPIDARLFKIITGEHLLKMYYSSPKKHRVFCSRCGSPIYSAHTDKPAIIRLRSGTITSEFRHPPDYQQYCESKSDWLEIKLDIPAFARARE